MFTSHYDPKDGIYPKKSSHPLFTQQLAKKKPFGLPRAPTFFFQNSISDNAITHNSTQWKTYCTVYCTSFYNGSLRVTYSILYFPQPPIVEKRSGVFPRIYIYIYMSNGGSKYDAKWDVYCHNVCTVIKLLYTVEENVSCIHTIIIFGFLDGKNQLPFLLHTNY